MTLDFDSVITEGAARQIAETIREAIMSGRLKVDERLPTEEDLADRFKVSRPTIREALKRLAAQNLIRSRRGPAGGRFVSRPNQEDLIRTMGNATRLMISIGEFDFDNIIEARQEMGLICCRLACQRRTKPDLEALKAELSVQKDLSITDQEFCASDVRFHHAVAQATKNPVLLFVMAAVAETLQPIANMVVYRFRDRQRICAQHERLFDAIRDGKTSVASKVFLEQMAYLRDIYTRAQQWRQEREVVAGHRSV
ncbi:MAG: FadR family transcriptional regulator [Alphaproteobacteria bacterium]|nr:FadR family transcriptional regulator [Alphaproteobacteria bacterium]